MAATYFDCNATTPLDERVLEAMLPFFKKSFGNPSAVYTRGRQARAAIDQAREQVAELVGAHPSQVIFTSGGTEANNFVLKGALTNESHGTLAVSAVEHASVRDVAKVLRQRGRRIESIEVSTEGEVTESAVDNVIRDGNVGMISVMWANNETGVVMPIAELAQRARAAGILFHTDAVQAVGKIPVDFAASGAHFLSMSAHKLYGPKGVGALVVDKSVELTPLIDGGGQEKGRRSGTENVAAIVGFGKAAELARQELSERNRFLIDLRHRLEAGLESLDGLTLFSRSVQRLPNTVFFSVAGIDGETLLMAFDGQGFEVASGSACASKTGKPSQVLLAMGVDESIARGAIRVSFGKDNTQQEVDAFLILLQQQIRAIRGMAVIANT